MGFSTRTFTTSISASAEKVWQVLWFDGTYRTWTSVFTEGSYAVCDSWTIGSKIKFLTPKNNGMYSTISECEPNKTMVFTHIGEIKDGIEQEEASWNGAKEAYALSETEKDDEKITTLTVTMETMDPNIAGYFDEKFPLALEQVKQLAENPVTITIAATVDAPIEKIWDCWTNPDDIQKWNSASPEWHTPRAENDLRVDGRFNFRMESVDGKTGFDFEGTYTAVELHKTIEYTMDDKRTVQITFETTTDKGCIITEKFHAESENSLEMQQSGWQSILDNFKKYVESNKRAKIDTDTADDPATSEKVE